MINNTNIMINNILEHSPIYFYFIKLLNTKTKIKFTFFLLCSIILNQILKNYIKEERPIPSSTYGMPSGHAQMMWFIVFYNMNEINNINLQIFLFLSALFISYDRIHREKHSIKQVIVGSIIGSLFGLITTNI